MPTVQVTDPGISARFDPEALATVQICARDEAGNAAPLEGFKRTRWPVWQVRALAELIGSRPDGGSLLRAKDYEYTPRPSALLEAAEALLTIAEACRQRRWHKLAPHRLDDAFFHYRADSDPRFPGAMYVQGCTVLSWLYEAACVAYKLGRQAGKARDVAGAELEAVADWITHTMAYPSIAPAREAELAAQGYTAAELLLDMAARHVADLAAAFESTQGPDHEALAHIAQEARLRGATARVVIKAGVRHTLGDSSVAFDRAAGGGER